MEAKKISSRQILNSMKKAIYQMLVETAKENGDIVISDKNGNPVRIKAKQALKNWNK
jgi:hypothetical protein